MSLKIKNKVKKKILIVEDDLNLSRVLKRIYENTELFITQIAHSKKVAKKIVKENKFDLVTLDVVLQDGNGLELVPFFNREQLTHKVIVLTKKDESKIKSLVFKLGVDDYMAKPFDIKELVCRSKKLLDLDQNSIVEKVLIYNNWIKLNRLKRELYIDSYRVRLSNLEYIILECFLENDGFVKRCLLIERLKTQYDSNFRDNYLNVAITRLRKKFYEITGMRLIENQYGVGYYINAEAES